MTFPPPNSRCSSPAPNSMPAYSQESRKRKPLDYPGGDQARVRLNDSDPVIGVVKRVLQSGVISSEAAYLFATNVKVQGRYDRIQFNVLTEGTALECPAVVETVVETIFRHLDLAPLGFA